MTLYDLKNKKSNVGTSLDNLFALRYRRDLTLKDIDEDYNKMETAIQNVDINKMITDDRVLFDDKTYKFVGYIE